MSMTARTPCKSNKSRKMKWWTCGEKQRLSDSVVAIRISSYSFMLSLM